MYLLRDQVKDKRKIQMFRSKSGSGHLQEFREYSDLTGKRLVFWNSGH